MKKILTLMMILAVCFIPLFADETLSDESEYMYDGEGMTFPDYLMSMTDDPDSIFTLSAEQDSLVKAAAAEALGEHDFSSYETIGMLHEGMGVTELYLYDNEIYHLISIMLFDEGELRDEMFSETLRYTDEEGFTDLDENPSRYVADFGEDGRRGILYSGDIEGYHYILSAVMAD